MRMRGKGGAGLLTCNLGDYSLPVLLARQVLLLL